MIRSLNNLFDSALLITTKKVYPVIVDYAALSIDQDDILKYHFLIAYSIVDKHALTL